ncbi:potassium channel family protein [Streptomyces sp. NRRL F-4428]|uniref:potassium channel family protein n=1 Tax=Streptomyces sp. NRRL F-4428 TaxID=1609137 RepID=UPI0005EC100D|nr:potassium channel family protein [Streptomyces sp. NRRL F-4428]
MERNADRRRRRILLRHCLRATAAASLLTALYYLAPLEGGLGVLTVLTLVLGLLAFGLLTAWQVSNIARSEYPRLSALEAMATAVPLFLIVFSATYFMLSETAPATFSETLDRTDALYFTVTVFATVGFGDIVPVTGAGRVLTTVQMIADLIVVGVIAKALFGAMKVAMRRRHSGGIPFEDAQDTDDEP